VFSVTLAIDPGGASSLAWVGLTGKVIVAESLRALSMEPESRRTSHISRPTTPTTVAPAKALIPTIARGSIPTFASSEIAANRPTSPTMLTAATGKICGPGLAGGGGKNVVVPGLRFFPQCLQ